MAQAEPHDGTYERLLARSRQASSAPNQTELTRDAYISDWCAALLDHVRRVPSLVGVHVQRHYAIVDGGLAQFPGPPCHLRADDAAGWEAALGAVRLACYRPAHANDPACGDSVGDSRCPTCL